jgi:hypothetical protein
MRRVPNWLSKLAIAIFLVAIPVASPFVFFCWIVHGKNVYADMMHEGHVVADAIHEHDTSVHVDWTTDGHGHPNLVVHNVFDTAKQDDVIAWAKAAKAQGHVHRHIVIDFQKEIPHSSEPDIILREAEF